MPLSTILNQFHPLPSLSTYFLRSQLLSLPGGHNPECFPSRTLYQPLSKYLTTLYFKVLKVQGDLHKSQGPRSLILKLLRYFLFLGANIFLKLCFQNLQIYKLPTKFTSTLKIIVWCVFLQFSMFWNIILLYCLLKSQLMFRRIICLHLWGVLLAACFMLVSYFAYTSTIKMETTHSSEMRVNFQWRLHGVVSQKTELHNHHCENLTSHKLLQNSVQNTEATSWAQQQIAFHALAIKTAFPSLVLLWPISQLCFVSQLNAAQFCTSESI
jgi:hypothetical protein